MLRNSTEERSSYLLRGGSLKSHKNEHFLRNCIRPSAVK